MSLLFGREARSERRVGGVDDLGVTTEQLWAARRKGTVSGQRVTPETVITHDAAWAAVTLIQTLGSTVPLAQIEQREEERVRVPLSQILADPDPDPSIDAVGFRSQCLWSAAVWGNAYAEVVGPGARFGRPESLVTLEPERVKWRRNKDTHRWEVLVDDVVRERWPLGNLWHWPLNLRPGRPWGMNPVQEQSETFGVGLAARDWSASYFGHGPLPLMIFTNEARKDPGTTGAKRLKSRIMEAFDGSRDPVLLPQGVKGEQVKISANESQFIETQRLAVEQAARVFFGGFPEMIGGAASGSAITYANLEQRVTAFTGLALMPRYLVPFEKALGRLVPSNQEVKHKIDAIVRADLAARFAAYMQNAQIFRLTGQPVWTNDEVRDLEDRRRLDPKEYPPLPPSAAGRVPTVTS